MLSDIDRADVNWEANLDAKLASEFMAFSGSLASISVPPERLY